MIFGWWLLEQGVWIAPLTGLALFATWPKRRSRTLTTAICGLVAIFAAGQVGYFPARVSCGFVGGVPVCAETAGGEHVGDERRPGSAETLGADDRAVPSGSVGVEVKQQRSVASTGYPPRAGAWCLAVRAPALVPEVRDQ